MLYINKVKSAYQVISKLHAVTDYCSWYLCKYFNFMPLWLRNNTLLPQMQSPALTCWQGSLYQML